MTHIRPLTEYAELQRCVALQQIVWGGDFAELVPAALLWVGIKTGGVCAGAFDGRGELIGFVFGITGFVDGRPLHWSDMLAVHPAARGTGVGQALKRHQRAALLARGVTDVHWTFDPLESRNAHLNFARLGIVSREYIVDAYGQTSSHLHAGIGTDRLVAHWRLDSERVRARLAGESAPSFADVADVLVVNSGDALRLDRADERVLIRVPIDIQSLKQRDPRAAVQWREETRAAFRSYFARGHTAIELIRGDPASAAFSFYLLERSA